MFLKQKEDNPARKCRAFVPKSEIFGKFSIFTCFPFLIFTPILFFDFLWGRGAKPSGEKLADGAGRLWVFSGLDNFLPKILVGGVSALNWC